MLISAGLVIRAADISKAYGRGCATWETGHPSRRFASRPSRCLPCTYRVPVDQLAQGVRCVPTV